jgi:hypothetical protein
MSIALIVERIGLDKFTETEIRSKEMEILKVIGFDVDLPSVYETLQFISAEFLCKHKEAELSIFNRIRSLSLQFAMICSYCYDIYNTE